MAGVQLPLKLHTSYVHAIASSDDGTQPPLVSTITASTSSSTPVPNGERDTNKKNKNRRKKLLPFKPRWPFATLANRALCKMETKGSTGTTVEHDGEESETETFVSANSFSNQDQFESEFHSCQDDIELLSFRFSPGTTDNERGATHQAPWTKVHDSSAAPVKIVKKLPLGFVIAKSEHSMPSTSLSVSASVKKMMPMLAALHLWSRAKKINKKVIKTLKEKIGLDSGRDKGEEKYEGEGDDVFWKKDVRGLRCRKVEDPRY